MLIAPNTTKDKVRRLIVLEFSASGIQNTVGFWGSIASIIGCSALGFLGKMEKAELIALLILSFIALYFQYKYYYHKERIKLANSLHALRHQISEEIRRLDSYFYNMIRSSDPGTIDKQKVENDIKPYYTKICEILHIAFELYGIKPSGIFIKALDQKNLSLKVVAKKSHRASPDDEPLVGNLFARMLIGCLSQNEQLISDFNRTTNSSLPSVPINHNSEVPCLALCGFESEKFPSSLNEILNDNDPSSNNTQQGIKQLAKLKERIGGKYKSCLGFTISDRSQIKHGTVSLIPIAGFLGVDSQKPYDFEKIDKPFMEFLAGTADSLYATINMATVVIYAK